MPTPMNLSLTDELEREYAAKFRESVLAGLQDIIDGCTIQFKGSIEDVIHQAKARNKATI